MANPQCPGNGFSPRCSLRSRGLDRWFVLGGVLLSRTLAGAVPSALSGLASGFGMGAGRFPVAVTTETIVRVVRESLDNSIRLCGCPPRTRASDTRGACVGWVGCGPYSGRSLSVPAPPHSLTVPLARWLWWWGLLFVSAY